MRFPTWRTWFGRGRSGAERDRRNLRIGIPRALNVWSTHRFWVGFLRALGVQAQNIVFSSDTSEAQGRALGRGRGTVDCCHPVKCMVGHYGELLFGLEDPIHVLLSPMIYSLPSFLQGHVTDSLACSRVMMAAESTRAGFLKERDEFTRRGVVHASPVVSLATPDLVPQQLHDALGDVLGMDLDETRRAVQAGYLALEHFEASLRAASRDVLESCARESRPCVMVLARPYHMDPGLGHEIEADLQAHGFPVLWAQYFPLDADLMHWMFGREIAEGHVSSAFDISDVWSASYNGNTNEILWGAKVAARCPWVTCAIRLSSYECGTDQPTLSPTRKIVEATGTLFFTFGDLDETRPAGSVRIRVETIVHYARRHSAEIMRRKMEMLGSDCPLPAPIPSSTEDIPREPA